MIRHNIDTKDYQDASRRFLQHYLARWEEIFAVFLDLAAKTVFGAESTAVGIWFDSGTVLTVLNSLEIIDVLLNLGKFPSKSCR